MFSKEKGMMLKAAEDPNHPEFKKFMETNYQSTLKRLQDSEYSDVINLLVRLEIFSGENMQIQVIGKV